MYSRQNYVLVRARMDTQVHTFVCPRVCLSFDRPHALGPFLLIVLRVPHWGGRRGRLTVFPVGEALMLSPWGNAVQSYFPSIRSVSFNMYNHLQSHRALHAGRCLHLEASVSSYYITSEMKFDFISEKSGLVEGETAQGATHDIHPSI